MEIKRTPFVAPAVASPVTGPAARNQDTPASAPEIRVIKDPRPPLVRPTVREAMRNAEAKLEAWLGKAGAPPSVQYAVLFEGRLVHSGALGFKNLETGELTSVDTLYSINSMSKSLTAASIMQLVERGKLSLDTKVIDVVPEFARVRGKPELVASITVHQLLTHTSRLSRDATLAYWQPGQFWERGTWPTWDEVAEQLPKARVLPNPDKTVKYSNLTFMLLGQIIERVSGESYESYVARHIFKPLGMHDTGFTLDDTKLKRCAIGYEPPFVNGDKTERAVVPLLRTPNAMGSASGCKSTASDVSRWLAFLRDPASTAGVLSPESVATMRKTSAFDETQDSQYGYGLLTLALKFGTRAFGHTGSGMGFASVMRMTTDGSFGVVALTNDWSLQQNRAVDIILHELTDVARSAPKGAPPRDPAWAELLGTYQRGAGTKRSLGTNANGDLTLQPGAMLTPVPGKKDTFVGSGDNRSGDNDEEFFFLRDASGKVTHMLVGGTTIEHAQRVEARVG